MESVLLNILLPDPLRDIWPQVSSFLYTHQVLFRHASSDTAALQEMLIVLHVYKQPFQLFLHSLSLEAVCIVINSQFAL